MVKGGMEYIRRTYGVPAKRGLHVRLTDGKIGRITSVVGGTGWLRVRVDDWEKGRSRFVIVHPLEVDYESGIEDVETGPIWLSDLQRGIQE